MLSDLLFPVLICYCSGTPDSDGSSRSRSRTRSRSRELTQDGGRKRRRGNRSRSRSRERKKARSRSPVERSKPRADGVRGRGSVCYRAGTSPTRWTSDQRPTHYRYGRRQLTPRRHRSISRCVSSIIGNLLKTLTRSPTPARTERSHSR